MDFLKDAGMGADMVIKVALMLTFVFAIMFISYVHTSMKKSRGKEFGLLMTLGMTARDLGRVIILEDLILSIVSFVSGVFVGALFSRLVHMFINRLMDLNVPYSLSYKSFILTFASFFIIFTVVILWGWINIIKLDISKLLKEQRKTEYIGDGSAAAFIFGIIMEIVLVTVAVIALHHRKVALNSKIILPTLILSLIGNYLLIANMFSKILNFVKKRKRLYNRNMIMTTEIKYSMGKNKKLVFMSTILCTLIVYSSSSSLGLFSIIGDIISSSHKFDIEYIQTSNVNTFKEDEVARLIKKDGLILESKDNLKCLFINTKGIDLQYQLPVVAISNRAFNKFSINKVKVEKGEVKLSGDVINLPKNANINSKIQLGDDGEEFILEAPESMDILSNGMYLQNKFTIILNDEDFDKLQSALPKESLGTIYRYNVNNWRKTKNLMNELTAMSNESKNIQDKTGIESTTISISGNYYYYLTLKRIYSIFIFVLVFLALLFYVASVLMLFLRQSESMERTKRKYNQLRKIGITKKEFGKTVIGEVRMLFLTPVVFGVIMGYSLMFITEAMVGGSALVEEFMKNAAIATAIYIVIQAVASELSARRYLNRVIEEE
jgi:ABC-type antimicrobial peptide transport system permease subunit